MPPFPQQPSTGEVFAMSSPRSWLLEKLGLPGGRTWSNYKALRATIELCGARVVSEPAVQPECIGDRDGMFTRDIGVTIPHEHGPTFYHAELPGAPSPRERARFLLMNEREQLAQQHGIAGRTDGGNLIYDATRHVLFVGVNNVNIPEEDNSPYRHRFSFLEEQVDEAERVRRHRSACVSYAKPVRDWLADAEKTLSTRDIRVVPLFLNDHEQGEFYHLDGLFNLLPGGQAVLCPELMSKAAMHRVRQIIGEANLIPVSAEDAKRGATNFITVGHHVITPYASPALKEKLGALGYDVKDPPSVGLREGAWRFAPGGFVRCATQKMTADMAYPQAEKNRSAEAAVPSSSYRA